MKQPIEINIQELILHGFPPADRYKIGEAVRSELARMIMDKGLPQNFSQGTEIPGIDGGSFNMSKDMNPQTIGNHIARSVYGGLTK